MRVAVCVAAVVLSLGGCSDLTNGHPTGAPNTDGIEPTVSTPRPSRSTPAPPSTPAPSSPLPTAAPPGAETLAPQNGYVFIQTKSGLTRCQVSTAEVGCESQFQNAPQVDGTPANGVRLSADGEVHWVLGNLGDIPAVTLDYKTYRAVGWTIAASSDGTRFTNDGTGHGMLVRVEGVDVF
ncbi:hypothetical protein [Mycolicibacterium sp. 120266]|uniref:hypothetical protein n=1 Tax=Mycolicibacterium sp. 120266 TaxID=3090601 RepID=UPI0039A4548B